MFNSIKSLLHLPFPPNTTTPTLPLPLKTGSSDCTSSGVAPGQRAELLMTQTRRRSITWASTTKPAVNVLLRKALNATSSWTPSTPHRPRYGDRNGRSQCSGGFQEGYNTGQGLTGNIHRPMTVSAMIAHSYRKLQSSGHKDARLTMQMIVADTGIRFQDADEDLSKRLQHRQRRCQMLCNVPPRIIEATRRAVLTEEVQKERETQAILDRHRRTPHTIVLDSSCPDLAPHIVITPSPNGSEDPSIAEDNCAGPQNIANLCVPPFHGSTCRLPNYDEWVAIYYPYYPTTPQSQGTDNSDSDFYQGLHQEDHNDEAAYSDNTSYTDTSSCLGTPELQRVGDDLFSHLDDIEEGDITDCDLQSYSQDITSLYKDGPSPPDKKSSHIKSKDISHPIFFIYDDEEDDGPPEFDEWYTSRQVSGESS